MGLAGHSSLKWAGGGRGPRGCRPGLRAQAIGAVGEQAHTGPTGTAAGLALLHAFRWPSLRACAAS